MRSVLLLKLLSFLTGTRVLDCPEPRELQAR